MGFVLWITLNQWIIYHEMCPLCKYRMPQTNYSPAKCDILKLPTFCMVCKTEKYTKPFLSNYSQHYLLCISTDCWHVQEVTSQSNFDQISPWELYIVCIIWPLEGMFSLSTSLSILFTFLAIIVWKIGSGERERETKNLGDASTQVIPSEVSNL